MYVFMPGFVCFNPQQSDNIGYFHSDGDDDDVEQSFYSLSCSMFIGYSNVSIKSVVTRLRLLD